MLIDGTAGYTATDIMARLKRMQVRAGWTVCVHAAKISLCSLRALIASLQQGANVLHPIGWDAFGLPAEQYAIQTGTHPRITTERNINRFRQQLQSLGVCGVKYSPNPKASQSRSRLAGVEPCMCVCAGFSYDWDREVSTTDPAYYKWTQWIFLQLFKKGLAYQAEVPVNWCPALGTVLANEEVIDGKSERGDHPVVRLPMKQANNGPPCGTFALLAFLHHKGLRLSGARLQWMLRITQYADRLLDDLDGLDWPDSIKDMQRNWIGRSEGASIRFDLQGAPAPLHGPVIPGKTKVV